MILYTFYVMKVNEMVVLNKMNYKLVMHLNLHHISIIFACVLSFLDLFYWFICITLSF